MFFIMFRFYRFYGFFSFLCIQDKRAEDVTNDDEMENVQFDDYDWQKLKTN